MSTKIKAKCESKSTCGTCDECYRKYPSLRPSVRPQDRLGMFLREVCPPPAKTPGQEALAALDELLYLFGEGCPKHAPTDPVQ